MSMTNGRTRTGVFIDGAYFEKLMGPGRRDAVDFGRLARVLSDGKELLRTYYYDAPPFIGDRPTERDHERYDRKQRFFAGLLSIPQFAVRQGKTVFRGFADGKRVFRQKQVDSLLNVDLAVLAAKGSIGDAVVVAGDSDFVPGVKAAKAEGVVVHLYHGPKADSDLVELCDKRTLITDRLIDSVLSGADEELPSDTVTADFYAAFA